MKKLFIVSLLGLFLLIGCSSETTKVTKLTDQEICGLAFFHHMANYAQAFQSTKPYIIKNNIIYQLYKLETSDDRMLFFEKIANYNGRRRSEVGFFEYNHRIKVIARGEFNNKEEYLPVKISFSFDKTQTMWNPPINVSSEYDYLIKYIKDDYGKKYYITSIKRGSGEDTVVSEDVLKDLTLDVAQMQTREVL